MDDAGLLRYRCRVGHGFTGEALVDNQEQMVDWALWAAVRALEESAGLARRMATRARERHQAHTAVRYQKRAKEAAEQALALRRMATFGIGRPAQQVPEGEEKRQQQS